MCDSSFSPRRDRDDVLDRGGGFGNRWAEVCSEDARTIPVAPGHKKTFTRGMEPMSE
jgi:hypothetical protein